MVQELQEVSRFCFFDERQIICSIQAYYCFLLLVYTIKKDKSVCYTLLIKNNHCFLQASVIWNVILSSLCCKEDKTNWAFHLFKIYQQYEDNLLRRVLVHLRRSKMVSLNKKAKKMNKKEDKIPLNANPYQLSVSFSHKFLSRYQPDVYPSIRGFFRTLQSGTANF